MFVDKAAIHIKGGDGGDGCVSFHRAKYIPNGGPDGGDGGRGGSVVFVASSDMATLMDFKYKKVFAAEDGKHGTKNNCSGKNGSDLTIQVPVGTLVLEAGTNRVMADLTKTGEKHIIITGGRGGRGNARFATAVMQAPQYAEKGKKAKAYDIILELKLIADVGIIGYPNAGKSTLLSQATNAKPKIANYRFTTLTPNLGVIRDIAGQDFVMADIPGLIEGASAGAGLGFDFLRHIERTKVFIQVIDAAGLEGDDPLDMAQKLNTELERYNPDLLKRPMVYAANKTDIPEAAANVIRLKQKYEPLGFSVIPISAATGSGIQVLIKKVSDILRDYPDDITFDIDNYDDFIEPQEQTERFSVSKQAEHIFSIESDAIEKMLSMTNLDTEKGFAFFQRYMRDNGVNTRLKELGAKDGDVIVICGMEFDYLD